MKQDLQLLISACNQFYRLAESNQGGLVFGLYPVELVLQELQAKKKNYGANTAFLYIIETENGQTIDIISDPLFPNSTIDVFFPDSSRTAYPNLKKALEAVLNYMNISPEDLKDRFEKPDFMGEHLMPEDYV